MVSLGFFEALSFSHTVINNHDILVNRLSIFFGCKDWENDVILFHVNMQWSYFYDCQEKKTKPVDGCRDKNSAGGVIWGL